MKVIGISVVRNESDVIRLSITHALTTACDEVLVIDNGSTDGTWDRLQQLATPAPVLPIRDEGRFEQARMLTDLAHLAATRGADWIIPFDGDEFWWCGHASVREVLASVPASVGVLSLPVINFVAPRSSRSRRVGAIELMRHRSPGSWARREDVLSGLAAFVELRYPPKNIMRPAPGLRIEAGNHRTLGHDRDQRAGEWLACLHAPLRSLEQLERRAQLADRHRALHLENGSEASSWQFTYWQDLAQRGGLEAEWARNSAARGRLDGQDRTSLVKDLRLARIARRARRRRL